MKLFIANTTKYRHEFLYRLPERQKMFNQIIPSGQQLRIHSDDLTTIDVQHIIHQHECYGLVPASEVDRTKTFIGLCYSLDKPVPESIITRAFSHNEQVLTESSQDARKVAVAALPELARSLGYDVPIGLEVEVTEEATGPDDNREAGNDRMKQTIQFAQEGSKAAQRQGAMRDNSR